MPMVELSEPRGRYLLLAEREDIMVWFEQGVGVREIARRLGRAASTVSRELDRNSATRPVRRDGAGSVKPRYRASLAQANADRRARRPKQSKLAQPVSGARSCRRLRWRVMAGLRLRWSPQQIAVRLKLDFPDDPEMWVSHETIYQALYVQSRGGLRRELTQALRTGRAIRKPRRCAGERRSRGRTDMAMISERPAEADDRAVPGHWEGDLIMGQGNRTAIGTLVERSTRYVMLLHLPGGTDAVTVRDAMLDAIATLPEHLWRSLTWDQGKEMARHREISTAADLPIYFCDPHSPWQRGTNENTNGLLRQYFPKGTDLSVHTRQHLDAVAIQLNGRPRKTLNYQTPAETLNQLLSNPYPTTGVATTG
ncbi:IS30 family transposase [Kribbella antibiotica]|uniref:IS30 family transposase n=2 Tax=Kribbella antibiotica TaxID=190195 RepID=A0A4R4YM21_9ACTN|nr:IS30 family transposase [Kribbella antibiotica]TDD45510.1 IS30 family transposase [Kribbella antibiotica]